MGAATVFGLLLDSAADVQPVIDSQVLKSDTYGCTDGTTTGYMKLSTNDVVNKFIPYTCHSCTIIDV